MDTESLIRALGSDPRPLSPAPSRALKLAVPAAILLAAAAFFALLGPRHDIATAVHDPRFLSKFLLTGLLVVTGTALWLALGVPGTRTSRRARWLLAPLAAAVLAVISEAASLPGDQWEQRWFGTNAVLCMTFIPLIGVGPLAVVLLALRSAAPIRPALAGAVSGLVAGALAAMFYAAHCIDDSPFFVATWYSVAIATLAVFGAVAGSRLLRW